MRSPDGGPNFDPGFSAETIQPSLERDYPESHTAELLVIGLEQAAETMRNSPDALTRIIGEKLADKADVKRRVEDMMDGADDATRRQELKKLGIFVVREQEAKFSYEDKKAGFAINEGDPYLELHLPPVPKDLRSREEVERSLKLVAEYVQTHGIEARYLLGITYEKLGKLAKRAFGFGLVFVDPNRLPEDAVRGVARVYDSTGLYGDIGDPAVVYLETQTLLERAGIDSERAPRVRDRFPVTTLGMLAVALGARGLSPGVQKD